jgi:cellobiose phosphorylase
LRSEIYSIEQLERLARSLASSHHLAADGRAPNELLPRLNENEKVLVETYDILTDAVARGRQVAPAAEWLLDNFYVIEDHIRMCRRHLPRAFQRELPWLMDGDAAKYPRVYALAKELICHVDGQIDLQTVDSFISAYQSARPLKIGELWALPTMLRLALIENLRRVARRIALARREQEIAFSWFEQLVQTSEKRPIDLIVVVADLVRDNPPLSGAFLAELTRNIHGQNRHFSLVLSWLEQRLIDQGDHLEDLVRTEGQLNAADQVSVGNCITSLRFLSACDWKEFVERHSVVEQLLREDPAQVYGSMDFATRDRYRHVVEKVAARSPLTEIDVARQVLLLAQSRAEADHGGRSAHVGYYLLDKGRPRLEEAVRFSPSFFGGIVRFLQRYRLSLYLGSILVLTLLLVRLLFNEVVRHTPLLGLAGLMTLLLFITASHIGVVVVNWVVSMVVPPRPLPRLDFREGIPEEHRSMVVVPTILSDPDGVHSLIEGLEQRYLTNRDPQLCFALLTDFEDAKEQTMPDDERLVALAVLGIEHLNKVYCAQGSEQFFLFHRARQWNEREKCWMGYERKRGKLAAFNAYIQGTGANARQEEQFSATCGDVTALGTIKYVITLDTDTKLPHEAAHKMVGAMAHILNRPVLDAGGQRVIEGYSILQPRVGSTLISYGRSHFARLSIDDPGIDPYTHLVSDVYQDLFGEGSFIGKGIYDLSTFEQLCGFPENAILSHDLLESTYARSGLVSEVELFDDFPSNYLADIARRHRWIRGDWQLIWWLLPVVPNKYFKFVKNPISALSWWKIFDNLRRSLEPIAMALLLMLAFCFLTPVHAALICLFALTALGTAPVLGGLTALLRKPQEMPLATHLRLSAYHWYKSLGRFLFSITCLPFEAYICADAIVRTLVRVFITKSKLLEWKTSFRTERESQLRLSYFFRIMAPAPALAVVLFLILALLAYPYKLWFVAGPLLMLWLAAPALAFLLSQPILPRLFVPNMMQTRFLGKVARRTFRFFELLFTEKDNWLPPDNMQEQPTMNVASRTSPTNIGLALITNLAAYDFGFLSQSRLIERTRHIMGSLLKLERHHGHFLNWYDTQTLKPLHPRYISTVDSGNFVAYLLVLKSGLLELGEDTLLPRRMFEGLRDTLHVMLEAAEGRYNTFEDVMTREGSRELMTQIRRMEERLEQPSPSLLSTAALLQELMKSAARIMNQYNVGVELKWWLTTFENTCRDFAHDISYMAGWVELPPAPEMIWHHGSPEHRALLEKLKNDLLEVGMIPTLPQLLAFIDTALPVLDEILAGLAQHVSDKVDMRTRFADWFGKLREALAQSAQNIERRREALAYLAGRCTDMSRADFQFLFNPSRRLFTIGYNLDANRFDSGFYDLLASEARVASYLAIAEGVLGQDHWFALGRSLTTTSGAPVLLSWSGSMFEYLMPLLIMPNFDNTLLDQTYQSAVEQQINYGRQKNVPWGVSESGYNLVDVGMNYQYRAFGVPGLGLKRGLADDLVIAPYASALALMVNPEAAIANLERLAAEGRMGALGFYEAVDYTPSRLPRGISSVAIRQFMAHHQGMVMLSLAYLLMDRVMQRRFLADPMLRAAELLLYERIPRVGIPPMLHVEAETRAIPSTREDEMTVLALPQLSVTPPEVHLLSNDRYSVMITAAGSGYSRWRDLAVTRWREDSTRDAWGTFCYIRDVATGNFWSTTWQPTLRRPKFYEAVFSKGRADFKRTDEEIDTHTEIVVSPEDDIELRQISLTNRSAETRTLELTTYTEMVLASPSSDSAHPAFGKLFIQMELVRNLGAVLCTRRARASSEHHPWMIHLMSVRGRTAGDVSFELDRVKFIGRGRTLAHPAAMDSGSELSNREQLVLDPIASVRRQVVLEPGETVTIDVITGVAESREQALALAERYHDMRLIGRVFELAWTHSQIVLRQLGATQSEARTYGRLAGPVLYSSPGHRIEPEVLLQNRRGQSGLWGYGISGDLPIILLRIRDYDNIELARQLINAHGYLRMKGIRADLVIWNEDDSTYRQILHEALVNLIATSPEAGMIDKSGGIFIRRGDQMSPEDRTLMLAVARIVFKDDRGTLADQLDRFVHPRVQVPAFKPLRRREEPYEVVHFARPNLLYFNGFGGFAPDGREYVVVMPPGVTTPAPWVNILAGAEFGTVVSENGSVYTWSQNSHEFRLTPWSNDVVTDVSGEAFYIRDEQSGHFWSPSPQPSRGLATYHIRHGFGYTIFEYNQEGIASEQTVMVARDAPVKVVRIRITNRSGVRRMLSLTGYFEWVLGEHRDKTGMHVLSQWDAASGAIFGRNTYNAEFAQVIGFANCSETIRTVTTDRTEFIGRHGSLHNPQALHRVRLSGQVGPGFDPCAAFVAPFSLEHGEYKEIVFVLGSATSEDEARGLNARYCSRTGAQQVWDDNFHYWSKVTGGLQLETPDASLNFLANGWLVYQVMSARIFGRTGFYQSSGAFGFRDQLQDSMAMVYVEPQLLREHLLRAASRQFIEGDVQHWWHPPGGQGVRTGCSDDFLWLPYAACHYLEVTADHSVLEEQIPYLEGRPRRHDEEGYYDLPRVSEQVGTLYDHCIRAIDHGLRFGVHGLPLMGTGDWNDGMNLVGAEGRGESVWLAFFLYDVLSKFIILARQRHDTALADRYAVELGRLRGHIEEHAWDGEWYKRAFFDDGQPLGSSTNMECQIDSLPQSWAVLSGAAMNERVRRAMESAEARLVNREAGLIKLFDPPFESSSLDPGYIKGYLPGVRENGGQYTHGAMWMIMAFAKMGETDKAFELFSLVNPIHHGNSPGAVQIYQVEPYVVAADVYAVEPFVGRGGWTWYTGSAGWMYRLVLEALLGMTIAAESLTLDPHLPETWPSFRIKYRYRDETLYDITVWGGKAGTTRRMIVDGMEQPLGPVPLKDDKGEHKVEIYVGEG